MVDLNIAALGVSERFLGAADELRKQYGEVADTGLDSEISFDGLFEEAPDPVSALDSLASTERFDTAARTSQGPQTSAATASQTQQIDLSKMNTNWTATNKLQQDVAASNPGAVRQEAGVKNAVVTEQIGQIDAALGDKNPAAAGGNDGPSSGSGDGGAQPITARGLASDAITGAAITQTIGAFSPEAAGIMTAVMTVQQGANAFRLMGQGSEVTMGKGGSGSSSGSSNHDSGDEGYVRSPSTPQEGVMDATVSSMSQGPGFGPAPSADLIADINIAEMSLCDGATSGLRANMEQMRGVLERIQTDAQEAMNSYTSRVDKGVTTAASEADEAMNGSLSMENSRVNLNSGPNPMVTVSGAIA